MKPAIVDRYLFFECAKAWAGVAAVMLVLTLGMGFARFVSQVTAGDVPTDALLTVVFFSVLKNLEIVLPVSALLAVLLTVGRLCRDNEMAALAAGGVGFLRLYRSIGLFALLLVLLLAWLSFYVSPAASRSLEQLRATAATIIMATVEPGRFTVLDGGKAVFYAGAVEANGALRNVFIRLELDGKDAAAILTAPRAAYRVNAHTGEQTLILYDGWRYRGTPGQADYRITAFTEHGVSVGRSARTPELAVQQMPTVRLLASPNLDAWAELQTRIALPLSLLLLVFLAVPLGMQPPRAGYYPRLILGIVIFVAYANALRLGNVWLLNGVVPRELGLWWVHGLVVVLAGLLLAHRSGHLRVRPRRRARA